MGGGVKLIQAGKLRPATQNILGKQIAGLSGAGEKAIIKDIIKPPKLNLGIKTPKAPKQETTLKPITETKASLTLLPSTTTTTKQPEKSIFGTSTDIGTKSIFSSKADVGVKSNFGSGSITKSNFGSGIKEKTNLGLGSGLSSGLDVGVTTKPRIIPTQLITPAQKQPQKERQLFRQGSLFDRTPRTPTIPRIPTPTGTGIPLIPFGPLGFVEGRSGRAKAKRKLKRRPSVLAVEFGLRGSKATKGELSGLVVRPII